jgi:tetratricopeptide (TPR) repeat protein
LDRVALDAYRAEIEAAITGRETRDTVGARVVLGELERIAGRLPQAIALQEALLREAEDAGAVARSIGARLRLAESTRYAGETERAEAMFREALSQVDAHPAEGERYRHFAMQHLGKCLIDARRYEESLTVLHEALRIRREIGDTVLIESTTLAIALAEAQLDSPSRASDS